MAISMSLVAASLMMVVCCLPWQASAAAVNSPCGRQMVRKSRIVGGEEAYHGEFPWMVSIQHKNRHFCGGAILDRNWILTAAHCFNDSRRNNVSKYKIVTGEHKFNSQENPDKKMDFQLEKIVTHEEFSPGLFINDIALLKLTKPIQFDDFRQPICLPTKDETYVGEQPIVSGWGWTNEAHKGGKQSDVLRKLQVKIVDNTECGIWYREAGYPFNFRSSHMCGGFKEGKRDSCMGDSGGPMILKEADHFKVIGIVSSGIGCARPLLPGVYSRVSAFLPWIKNNMN